MSTSIQQLMESISVKLMESIGRSAVQSYPDEGPPRGLPNQVYAAVLVVAVILTVTSTLLV